MEVLIADVGNAQIKGMWGKNETVFQHAIAELRPDQWESALSRSIEQHENMIMVNGVPFAIDERAERYDISQRLTGAARYTPEYYGLFVAILLARLIKRSADEVFLFGSYPPGDWMYRENLMKAALGEWEVTYRDQDLYFNIVDVGVFEEPYGGIMNLLLKGDGRLDLNYRSISEGNSLVIDIGGHTTDILRIEPGGFIDEQSAQTVKLGTLKILDDLHDAVRARYASLLQGMNAKEPGILRDALRTGKYNTRGIKGYIDCTEEADQVSNKLVNGVTRIFQDMGGAGLFDTVVLTGGGGALLHDRLKKSLSHKNVILADKRGKLHMANVRGGAKLYKLYESKGMFNA